MVELTLIEDTASGNKCFATHTRSVLVGFSGFWWVLVGFSGFWWVLVDFSGFCEFLWVLVVFGCFWLDFSLQNFGF